LRATSRTPPANLSDEQAQTLRSGRLGVGRRQEMREAEGLRVVERDGGAGAGPVWRFVDPDAQADVARLAELAEIARDAKRLPGVERGMRSEELDELQALRRRTPGAVPKPALDGAPAAEARADRCRDGTPHGLRDVSVRLAFL
jgi:hypothetical protein